eukprot:CAMPEP_0201476848 /NCGR_PEP_ID=MMETSP0151_2-20130828/1970_1 /ASSEMBLY_ACC=CAM_ASM_000257 /TAXON_ID=200890 /ORGANISM="Paramoeba atlantica, Strain 621/1 / CCAP 1560/9" /LENGTH=253 /DNA_ID=CAMNT_0047857357 /DNA_START=44 /DNA_END=802 /DNA_ORIENTATION=-
MAMPDVEYLYETQVKEFQNRYNLMREKMTSMYLNHEGFRDAFEEIWENVMDVDDRRQMMAEVMKRVEENLPPPKHKALMLLGKTCPELFHDELVLGKTIKMIEFMDYVVAKKENSPKYPFTKNMKVELEVFLKALPASVYPQFSRHPKEAQYTWSLLWEQRSFWICHFALNMVAEMCSQISQFKEVDEQTAGELIAQESSPSPSPSSSSSSSSSAPSSSSSSDEARPPPPEDQCDYCGAAGELKRCARCKGIW